MKIRPKAIKRILQRLGSEIYPFPVDKVDVGGEKVKISFFSSRGTHPVYTVVRDREEVEEDITRLYEKERVIAGMIVDCDLLGIPKVGLNRLYGVPSVKVKQLESKFREGIKPYLSGYSAEMPRCVMIGSGMQTDIIFEPHVPELETKPSIRPVYFEKRREKAISEILKERGLSI